MGWHGMEDKVEGTFCMEDKQSNVDCDTILYFNRMRSFVKR